MTAEQILENYILKHPDYWDFENEIKEVARLKKLCKDEAVVLIFSPIQSNFQQQLYV